jgi:hypothetical protein
MEFDATLSYKGINFGLMDGKNGLIIIKTGSGGSIFGNKNKYILLAARIKSLYDTAVIVSDNPLELPPKENMDYTMAVGESYYIDESLNQAYYFGVSKGGQYAAMYAYQYKWVTKWLILNMPLFINWHKSRHGLEQLSQSQQMYLLFGDLDPSFKYSSILDTLNKVNIKKIIIPNADHIFSTSTEEFITLPDKYLFPIISNV